MESLTKPKPAEGKNSEIHDQQLEEGLKEEEIYLFFYYF